MPFAKDARKSVRGGSRVAKTWDAQTPASVVAAAGTKRGRGRPSTFSRKISLGILEKIHGYGEYISVSDTAEVFNVTTQTIRKWIDGGSLPKAFSPKGFTDRKLYMLTSEVVKRLSDQLTSVS